MLEIIIVKRSKLVLTMCIVILIILIDQITKIIIDGNLIMYQSIEVIPDFFSITHIRNTGIAFGFLAQSSHLFRSVFLTLVPLFAIFLIIFLLYKAEKDDIFLILGLSMIMGGAFGNLIDRVRLGAVIDFLDFYLGSYHWPAFNMADSAITLGALILFATIVKEREK